MMHAFAHLDSFINLNNTWLSQDNKSSDCINNAFIVLDSHDSHAGLSGLITRYFYSCLGTCMPHNA